MARESHHSGRSRAPEADAVPNTPPFLRRAGSTEPTPASVASRRSITIKTPGSQGRGRSAPSRPQGLSASGRKPGVGASATPHARAAFRAIDSRRAAISTPHRPDRRRSVREARETPRDFLLSLGRALAKTSEPIKSSSSPKPGAEDEASLAGTQSNIRRIDDDDDDDDLPKRPRLSLPIDVDEDDDDDLRPHRSAGLEDEDVTVRSVEMARRAYSEQPRDRMSMGSAQMSDIFAPAGERLSEVGIDSGFFPPLAPIATEEDGFRFDDDGPSYDRSDFDAARRETLARVSDFGIEVPLDMANESALMLAPEVEESPVRPADDFAPMLDQRSDDEDEPEEEARGGDSSAEETVGLEAVTAKSATKKGTKKRTTKVSRYGMEYPSLPPGVVKRLAQTFAKSSGAKGKISPDALKAIMQASDWFFEQVGDDLSVYAKHAHRKTIDESDMLTLLKIQRQTSSNMTPFALAQRHLPRELLQELRMTPPIPLKKSRKADGDVEDGDVT